MLLSRTYIPLTQRVKWLSLTLGLLALGSVACSRVRDIPLDQVPRLTAEVRAGRPAIVRSVQGKEVEIQSFSRVEIVREQCPSRDYCVPRTLVVADHPLRASLYPNRFTIEAVAGKRRHRALVESIVPLDGSKTWARVSKRSASRGALIVGAAATAALAFGAGTYLLVNANSDDPHHLQPLIAGVLAGGAAGSATLLFTFPSTRDLGDER